MQRQVYNYDYGHYNGFVILELAVNRNMRIILTTYTLTNFPLPVNNNEEKSCVKILTNSLRVVYWPDLL